MKKTSKYASIGMCSGMLFGVAIGSGLGNPVFGSTSMGLTVGLCGGMCLGMVLGYAKDAKINKQLEEKGYRVKFIDDPNEEYDYPVTVVDHDGEEKTILVKKSEMEYERLNLDDFVFLSEDGRLLQAFEK